MFRSQKVRISFLYLAPYYIYSNMESNVYDAKVKCFLDHFSKLGYSSNYASFLKLECERVSVYLSSTGTFDGYLDGYQRRYGLKLCPMRRWAISAIRSYLESGRLPSRRHPARYEAAAYGRLSEDNRSLVDSYIASHRATWSSSTSATIMGYVSVFLHYIQSCGPVTEVTEGMVWSYFYDSAQDMPRRGYKASCEVRRFLRWLCAMPGGECYGRILEFVPAMKQTRKVFDCLTEEEDICLVHYVTGDGCGLSLRDRAIFTVARFCGLRASDISALRMDDIDLGRSRLSVRQRKTGVALEQALRPVVGNAICRYVAQERPLSDLPELFLIDDRDVRPLTPSAVGGVCDKVYRLAGVRQDGRRGGSHLLRHRFAQSLVDSGACDAAAMRLLGHTSPSSLNVYLDTDQKRLRDCALSISGFAIGKEVLA